MKEDSAPIPLEYMESYKKQMQEQGHEMYLSLLKEYEKENSTNTFYAYELDMVNNKIINTTKYIQEIEEINAQKTWENNGLSYGLKTMPDFLSLQGYKDFLCWLENKKKVLMNENNIKAIEIPQLKFNPEALPEVIFNSFCSIDIIENQYSIKKRLRRYPFSVHPHCKDNYNCYLLVKDHEFFINKLRNKQVRDENNEPITRKLFIDYMLAYAKGFTKGYSEFIPSITQGELFSPDKNDLVYTVFQRVWGKGNTCSINMFKIGYTDYEDINTLFEYIDTDLMFQQGIKGGEYYKAWEIILSNPKQFEPLFQQQNAQPQTKELPKQLKTNLSDPQRGTLFELLKESGFIPNDSDENSFIWAFGGNGELEFEYKAIKWNYGNNALFELLEIVTETVSNENLRNCINLFINKKEKQITNREKISRPKKDEPSNYKSQIESIEKKIKNPTTPTA